MFPKLILLKLLFRKEVKLLILMNIELILNPILNMVKIKNQESKLSPIDK